MHQKQYIDNLLVKQCLLLPSLGGILICDNVMKPK